MVGRRGDDDYVADEQLTLAEDDERLPWLESGDEDEEDGGGVDGGRVFGFVLLALLALGAFIGGIWWFGNRASEAEALADGSTITAPPGPYKERPADPGGKQFEGTGNLAPAVGEGERREGRLAAGAPSATPAPPSAAPRAAASGSAPSAASGVAVQVGAYSSMADAEAGWQKLLAQTDKLAGVSHRVVQGQADIGTVFRLQAVAGDAAAASRLCAALKADGVACQVKR